MTEILKVDKGVTSFHNFGSDSWLAQRSGNICETDEAVYLRNDLYSFQPGVIVVPEGFVDLQACLDFDEDIGPAFRTDLELKSLARLIAPLAVLLELIYEFDRLWSIVADNVLGARNLGPLAWHFLFGRYRDLVDVFRSDVFEGQGAIATAKVSDGKPAVVMDIPECCLALFQFGIELLLRGHDRSVQSLRYCRNQPGF